MRSGNGGGGGGGRRREHTARRARASRPTSGGALAAGPLAPSRHVGQVGHQRALQLLARDFDDGAKVAARRMYKCISEGGGGGSRSASAAASKRARRVRQGAGTGGSHLDRGAVEAEDACPVTQRNGEVPPSGSPLAPGRDGIPVGNGGLLRQQRSGWRERRGANLSGGAAGGGVEAAWLAAAAGGRRRLHSIAYHPRLWSSRIDCWLHQGGRLQALPGGGGARWVGSRGAPSCPPAESE